MAKAYYTLCVHYHFGWSPEFGDYDRSVVQQERDDFRWASQRPWKAKDFKIIATGGKQTEINAAVAAMNVKEKRERV